MTEEEERAQLCICTHRKDAHWLHPQKVASVGKGKGKCAYPGCPCPHFATPVAVRDEKGNIYTVPQIEWPPSMPHMIPGPIFTKAEQEDLELAAAELRTGWARHNPGVQRVADLLSMMARTIVTKPKEGR